MSSNNEKVDFLLEIMKARVTARQEVVCDEAPAGPLSCGGCCVHTEVREQPPKPSPQPKSHSSRLSSFTKDRVIIEGFDFFGNPIARKTQTTNEPPTDPFCGDSHVLSAYDTEVLEQPSKSSTQPKSHLFLPSSVSRKRSIIKGFDFYGNPIFEQEHQDSSDAYSSKAAVRQPTSIIRNVCKPNMTRETPTDNHSEFLETSPASSSDDEDVNPSCVVELGHCMGLSLMELFSYFRHACEDSSSKEKDIIKALNEEINALSKSSQAKEVNELMLYEIRALEMDCEISRQKALLVKLTEDRMLVETHLNRLNSFTSQGSGSLSKTNSGVIPTDTLNQPPFKLSTLIVDNEVKQVTWGPTISSISVLAKPSHSHPEELLSPSAFRTPQASE